MRYSGFSFQYTRPHTSSNARIGTIITPHGRLKTPAFIFCATKANIKTVAIDVVKKAGTQIILSNTYHLMIQPGDLVVKKMGGLQKFMGWHGPMLTDSGGFQMFSLGCNSIKSEIKNKRKFLHKELMNISEDGALFKSSINGKKWLLSPEKSIEIQSNLGADLIITLDECTPFDVDKQYTEYSMQRSNRWAIRSLKTFDQLCTKQALYAVIQGGVYQDLRQQSCHFVNDQDFFGHAIGGCLGKETNQMYEIVLSTIEYLALNRPIHLLGIGYVKDVFACVQMGIDTFDCVQPTRLARRGRALIKRQEKEYINLLNACYKEDISPIEYGCPCTTCKTYTRAYLHHLLKAKEILAQTLITVHNITFMNLLMIDIRQGIELNSLNKIKKMWLI